MVEGKRREANQPFRLRIIKEENRYWISYLRRMIRGVGLKPITAETNANSAVTDTEKFEFCYFVYNEPPPWGLDERVGGDGRSKGQRCAERGTTRGQREKCKEEEDRICNGWRA